MLDGRVLGASQVEYKPFGKPPVKRETLVLTLVHQDQNTAKSSLSMVPGCLWNHKPCSCAISQARQHFLLRHLEFGAEELSSMFTLG